MNFHLSIRVKLFLSILFAILASYAIFLFLTVHTIEESLENKTAKDLETNLRFFRYQFTSGANQLRYVLLFPSTRPQVKDYLREHKVKELAGVLDAIRQALPFLPFAAFVDRQGEVITSLNGQPIGTPFALSGLVRTGVRKREAILSFELIDRKLFSREGAPSSFENTSEQLIAVAVAFP
ncbi:MAG TPA: hypothetical protein PLI53_06915, partial [Geobacteraceae bacterium]|nr:hypothetical protein [Geobacteraceae bacterium]